MRTGFVLSLLALFLFAIITRQDALTAMIHVVIMSIILWWQYIYNFESRQCLTVSEQFVGDYKLGWMIVLLGCGTFMIYGVYPVRETFFMLLMIIFDSTTRLERAIRLVEMRPIIHTAVGILMVVVKIFFPSIPNDASQSPIITVVSLFWATFVWAQIDTKSTNYLQFMSQKIVYECARDYIKREESPSPHKKEDVEALKLLYYDERAFVDCTNKYINQLYRTMAIPNFLSFAVEVNLLLMIFV
jgi:hypothetical protein